MNRRYSRRQVLAGGTAAAASGLLLNGRARAQTGPIRIGMLQSVSGPFSSLGSSHVIGARIAVKMINDGGGVNGRPIELVVRDTRGNAGEMVAGLRELAGSGINLIIGEAVSGLNIAAQPVAPSLDVVYVLSTSIAMELTHELANRNCFRAHQNAFMQFGGEAKLIADRYPNLKRWGCYAADAAGLRVSQEYLYYGLKKSYGAQGKQIELLEPVLAKIGAADYRNQITKLVGQNLEGIVLADSGANLLSFIKQAIPFGLFNSVGAVAELTFYPPMHAALKKETPQNWWTNCSWIYELYKSQPMAETFYKLAFEETKTPLLDPYLAQAHLAVTAMVSGVRAAKSTKTDDVINALETITFDSIYGPVAFRKEDHQLQVNGTFIRLGPDDSETGWSIKETVQIPWKDTIEPPTPGKKFELT